MFKKVIILTIILISPLLSRENPLFKKIDQPYSEGRLSVGVVGNFTHYYGEFDNTTGNSLGLESKYTLPFMPELSFGARFSQGNLSYYRSYKERFTKYYEEQFPAEYFPEAMTEGAERKTDITSFEFLAYFNMFPRQQLNYYAFAGFGVLRYQPQDIKEAPKTNFGTNILWEDFNDEDQFNATLVGGIGVDYFVTKNFSVGVQGSFRYFKTDMLDAFALAPGGNPTASDHYFDYGMKLSYYMFDNNDSDGDGILNEEEISYGTNPFSPDTDDDLLSDYDEIYTHKTSPVLADTDKDGLSDYEEITLNLNPNKVDTDDDLLSDFEEVRIFNTYAHLPDSDFDGVIDSEEIKNSTNPKNSDTDGDTIGDSEDECPNSPGPKEFKGCPQYEPIVETRIVKDTLIIPMDTIFIVKEAVENTPDSITKQIIKPFGINFMKNSAEILIESELILDDIAKWIIQNDKKIEVQGHTDSDGDEYFNLELSTQRAISVKQYLIDQGVNPENITARGFGENHPIDLSESRKAKARNRRIEFVVVEEYTKK